MSKSKKVLFCAFMAVVFSCSPGFGNFADQTATLAPGMASNADGDKAAWGDYNNDGHVDLVTGGTLWRNHGDGTGFTSMGGIALYSVWADYNNDGLLDMFKTGAKELWRNNGDWTFTNIPLPVLPMAANAAASWADHDNDGHVDLYVTGEYAGADQPDAILRNQGDNTFVMTWQQPVPRFGRGVTSCDFDRDGYQDVYVSNYWQELNLLWHNNGSGAFTDVAGLYDAQAGNGHSIGAAWGDFDNDGDFDLFAGNFAHPGNAESRFLENTMATPGTPAAFFDRGTGGVTWVESYFTPALADYDNDGDLDLFFTTVYDGDDPRLFRNNGNWTFTDVTAAEGLSGLGKTRMAAWGDYDNDGDLDLATDGRIMVNDESQAGTNHWLKVKLTGSGTINGAAIGSEVRINLGGGQILTRQVEGGTGMANQNELTLHFGLGSHTGPVDLEISASGLSVLIEDVAVDQMFSYTVDLQMGGDVNEDGFVGGADLTQVLYNWGMTGAGRSDGDLDGDGTVGGADYTEVQSNWGNGTPPEPPGTVPEPAALSLLLLGGLTLVYGRRSSTGATKR